MLRLCYALFVIGLGFYVVALFFIGTDTGQTVFYAGTGVLLTTAVMLLLRLSQLAERQRG
ncbi:MAG: hypothetical protein JSV86_01765 [Gemmatimonadota bacterium]|nr:MAG: hypothetical protein JSV86_01765 [Gemmatimonadota bacterium]